MAVTIINSGVTFTFNEGDVTSINTRIVTSLDFDAMPGSTPDNALLFDFNGVSKVISFSGNLSNSGTTRTSTGSVVTLDEQRKWLEKNLNGLQSGSTFSSNYSSTWNGSSWINSKVLFGEVSFDEKEGNPLGLEFSINLYVGNV